MTDNVIISAVADGVFEKAFGDLPPWATEDTAMRIEAVLKRTLNLQTKAFSDMAKQISQGSGSTTGTGSNDKELPKKVFKQVKDQYDLDKKNNKEKNEQQKDQKGLLSTLKTKYLGWASAAALATIALDSIEQAIVENYNTYTKLNEAGINLISGFNGVTDGFSGLAQLSQLTGVRFTELSETMIKYSSAINQFGAGKFAKAVGTSSANLAKFGFTAKEGAELIGGMLEAQQGFVDTSGKSYETVSREAEQLGKSISRLSQANGMARSAILANMVALSQSTDANVVAGQIGNEAAEGMTTFLGSFKNQDVAKKLLALFADPIKPLNETFQNFQKVGLGGFANKLTAFQESIKDMPAELKDQALKGFMDRNAVELNGEKQRLQLLAQSGVEGARASLEVVVALQQQANSIKKLSKEEIEAQEKTNKARASFSTQWERLTSIFQRTFTPSVSALNLFTKFLTKVNDFIDPFAKKLSLLFNDITDTLGDSDEDLSAVFSILSDTFSFLVDVIKDIWNGLKDVGIVDLFHVIWDGLKVVTPLILGVLKDFWAFFKAGIEMFEPVFKWLVSGLMNGFKVIFSILAMAADGWSMIFQGLKSIIDWISKPLKSILGNIFGSDDKKDVVQPTTKEERDKAKENREPKKETISLPAPNPNTAAPTTPKSSTLDSPSAVSTDKNVGGESASQKDGNTSPVPGKDKPSGDSGINSHLAYQNVLLEQLLHSSTKLVSVNQDQLKYQRAST